MSIILLEMEIVLSFPLILTTYAIKHGTLHYARFISRIKNDALT